MLKICMIGLGYIGLPTAALMADHQLHVIGVDINPEVVTRVNQAQLSIAEPGLTELVKKVVDKGNLIASLSPEHADVFMIAVPTPFLDNKKPDLSYVKQAVESIAPFLEKGNLVILESTSPVDTTSEMACWIQEKRPDLDVPRESQLIPGDISIAYCPERVLPGRVLEELRHNDRVIGGLTACSADQAAKFYQLFVMGRCIKTNARTAAMCKLAENAYRDVNIAFANELSMICDEQRIDVDELRELANRHPRVNILKPGPGVGGHCIAVDPWFIVDAAPERAKLIRCSREVNDSKPRYVVKQVEKKLKEIASPKVLCLGLSYKPNIDDLRESPAVEVVKMLAKNTHYTISVCEPYISRLPECFDVFENVVRVSIEDVSGIAMDYCLQLVNHDCFSQCNFPVVMS